MLGFFTVMHAFPMLRIETSITVIHKQSNTCHVIEQYYLRSILTFISLIVCWKRPPRALHSFSILHSIVVNHTRIKCRLTIGVQVISILETCLRRITLQRRSAHHYRLLATDTQQKTVHSRGNRRCRHCSKFA